MQASCLQLFWAHFHDALVARVLSIWELALQKMLPDYCGTNIVVMNISLIDWGETDERVIPDATETDGMVWCGCAADCRE